MGDNSIEELKEQLKEVAPEFDIEEYFRILGEFSIELSTKFNSILYILVFAPVTSLFTFLFFSGRRKKFAYHYVMNLYGMTQAAILTLLTMPVIAIWGQQNFVFTYVSTFILLAYVGWVIYSYVPGEGAGDVIKIIIAMLLSYALFSIVLAIIMYIGAAIKMFYF